MKGTSKAKKSEKTCSKIPTHSGQTLITDSGDKVLMPSGTFTLCTQTDEDFENFVIMSSYEYDEYLAYKHLQMMHQHLVNDIVEEDFSDFDKDTEVCSVKM